MHFWSHFFFFSEIWLRSHHLRSWPWFRTNSCRFFRLSVFRYENGLLRYLIQLLIDFMFFFSFQLQIILDLSFLFLKNTPLHGKFPSLSTLSKTIILLIRLIEFGLLLDLFFKIADFLLQLLLLGCQILSLFQHTLQLLLLIDEKQFLFLLLKFCQLLLRTHFLSVQLLS